MALWVCTADGVAYSVGAPACPQCGTTSHVEQGSEEHEALMPKITKHGGPSVAPDAGGRRALVAEAGPEITDLAAGAFIPAGRLPVEGIPAAGSEHELVNADAPDYDSWTLVQLRADLTGRGLPTSGNKADLIARLRADDQQNSRLADAEGVDGTVHS